MSNSFTLVLDAGHGGTTLAESSTPNNTIGANGLLEKDLTLKVARAVGAKLNSNRFQTFLTRDEDRNLSLAERAKKAREVGADAFISIHFNGHRDAGIDGTAVFISNGSDEKDSALANELLKTVSKAASIPARGVRKTNFTILSSDYHVAKTAACLIEMAYLTNPQQSEKLLSPDYIDRLATAVAQSVVNYSNQAASAQSLADQEKSEKTIAEATREHADPKNFPIDLPEPGKGTDTISITIPKNLRFSRWEIEVLASSAGAGCKVAQAPKAGAEGEQKISVDWWHLPYGKINYKLKAYASPDGSSEAPTVVYDSKGWTEQARNQLQQGQGVNFAVRGEKAKLLYEALKKREANAQGAEAVARPLIAGVDDAIIIGGIVAVVIAAIIAACIALGMLTLGAILKMAMDKGYDVKDTKYKAAAGEGEKRQEHELAFNLFKPK
jgi:N-acetylmuramoyl-L-alanine amidase